MKRYPDIDYAYQPPSYWEDRSPLYALLRNVKGTERRAMIRSYFESGRMDEFSADLLPAALDADTRDRIGRIHPAFMGGEYLPNYWPGEIELVRLELCSVTQDVISLRVRPRKGRNLYRVVDEYGTAFELARRSSRGPLSLEQLIDLIDRSAHPEFGTGLALVYNEHNADGGGRADLRHFTRVASDLYPELEAHYECVFEDWVAEEAVADDDEEGGPAHEP